MFVPFISQSLSEFHSDLFPDTAGGEPALTATQWCSGDNTKVGKNLVTEGAKKRNLAEKKTKKICRTWLGSNQQPFG